MSLDYLQYLVSEVIDQYTGICKEAIVKSAAKVSKSFEKLVIEVLLLYMVVPGKIYFTQLGSSNEHANSSASIKIN